MEGFKDSDLVALPIDDSLWNRFFTVAPLVVVGTKEAHGSFDLAPKHMAFPMGWSPFFGFVCTPEHRTYQNIRREQGFTVSYPQPDDILLTGLAAAPRCGDQSKTIVESLPTFKASKIDGVFLQGGYLFFECELFKIIDGFGQNSLITGKIVAARIDRAAIRVSDQDDSEVLRQTPLLAFLYPNRFASVGDTMAFPFPKGFRK